MADATNHIMLLMHTYIWALSQYKDCLSRYGDSRAKDKMIVRPSYL